MAVDGQHFVAETQMKVAAPPVVGVQLVGELD